MSTARRLTEERFELGPYVEAHPVGSVLAAFGVGYLLSGALFSRATARILGLGVRYATPVLVRAAFGANAAFNPGQAHAHVPEREAR
jgi:hypothetical protein